MSSSKEDTTSDHPDAASQDEGNENESSTNVIPTDEIMVASSRDESIPPVDWDESIRHLEEDLQKLVDHLESLEKDLDTTQKRYHIEQQRTLTQRGNRLSTKIVDYEVRAKELEKAIKDTQELIDLRSTCTSDSRTKPDFFSVQTQLGKITVMLNLHLLK
jgi:chromosome segregation ATPase